MRERPFIHTPATSLVRQNRRCVQDAANGPIQTKNRLEEALHLDGKNGLLHTHGRR